MNDKPIVIKKIVSDKHIDESPEDFKLFLVNKKSSTIKRYIRYRKHVLNLRSKGYHARTTSKKGYVTYKKGVPRQDKDLPKYDNYRRDKEHIIYSHYYKFVCDTPSMKNKKHRHSYESRTPIPNKRKIYQSHERHFIDHNVKKFGYVGTWEIY